MDQERVMICDDQYRFMKEFSENHDKHYDILKVEDIFIEPVDEIEKHGLKDKGGTTEHQYIVLTKC